MSDSEVQKEYWDLIAGICEGRPEAYRWFQQVVQLAAVWDDIEDSEQPNLAQSDGAFQAVLTEWPVNAFFREFGAVLAPVAMNAISAWRHSNRPEADKIKAYDVYTEIPCTMAFLFGGRAMVDRYMPRIRQLNDERCRQDDLNDNGAK